MSQPTITTSSIPDLIHYFDSVLNLDKSTFKTSNDEPTPINCINDMIAKIPAELWQRPDLKILDPCCGNGNFGLAILNKLLEDPRYTPTHCLESILYFNDINQDRLANVRTIFGPSPPATYNLNISGLDFLSPEYPAEPLYDLIVANPPYAKLMADGSRTSKNHNLIKPFIQASLDRLKAGGYLMFLTPDNWMSYADRNELISILTGYQIVHLDIHSAKKYFKKIGSSFTWYIIQKTPAHSPIQISGIWKGQAYTDSASPAIRKYIPLLYGQHVKSILDKTVDNPALAKYQVQTSSDLHKYTKRALIQDTRDDIFKYKLIHTPRTVVYASRPHKWQAGYKVFISTTDKYGVFVDNCGMTQSIAFILCANEEEARRIKSILEHPLYVFINNICRWGNFNNIRILQSFPVPGQDIRGYVAGVEEPIYSYFGITETEKIYITEHL